MSTFAAILITGLVTWYIIHKLNKPIVEPPHEPQPKPSPDATEKCCCDDINCNTCSTQLTDTCGYGDCPKELCLPPVSNKTN